MPHALLPALQGGGLAHMPGKQCLWTPPMFASIIRLQGRMGVIKRRRGRGTEI